MSWLAALRGADGVRTVDLALADSLRRLEPSTPDLVLAAAALASLAVARGHAAFDPARPRLLLDADLAWPAPGAWAEALSGSCFVATPASGAAEAASAPLVLERGLVYLRRYREYERRLALRLQRIAAHAIDGEIAKLAPLFARLFPDAHGDAQARAAALALRRSLLLVTGGPGTGKTTTIARLLALRVAQALQAGDDAPRIALAAPTGRAADRMAGSMQRAIVELQAAGTDAGALAALPRTASTLHRLLGTIPDAPRFRHDAAHPLPFDIVVVDEASMVDLPLMCKLAEAVADGAQLILLGDADQLPSVEAGDVLAAILHAAGDGDGLARADADALRPLLGESAIDPATGGLHGHRVELRRGWRQHDALELAPLADAVRSGDVDACLRLLRGGELSNVHFHELDSRELDSREVQGRERGDDPLQCWPRLLAHFQSLATCNDPAEALREAGRVRVLTALRDGRNGASGLNARIEARLCGLRPGTTPDWYRGRLVLVTENSDRHGLFNGDVGICLADADDTPLVWFAGGAEGSAGLRAFHPGALPAHAPAFAMTVHKAQGSEFDEVWLQLPRQDARVLSRELLYTGLTRARNALHIAASAEAVAAAVSRHARRVSGLAWRLADVPHEG